MRQFAYVGILLVAFVAFLTPALITQAGEEELIRGTILDGNGRGLSGAEVSLRVPQGACSFDPSQHVRARSVTDEDGRYVLPAPKGAMEIYVRHSGHAPGWTDAEDGLALTLQTASWIEGTVNTPATITVSRGPWRFAQERIEGQFRVGPFPPGLVLSVTVESPTHRPQLSLITLDQDETRELDVTLARGSELRGSVFPPHAGATIRAHGRDGREFTATTADDGTFTLTGPEAGWVRLVAISPGRPVRIVDTDMGGTVEVRWSR